MIIVFFYVAWKWVTDSLIERVSKWMRSNGQREQLIFESKQTLYEIDKLFLAVESRAPVSSYLGLTEWMYL